MPETPGREVIVVGDKVLIKPEEESSKTPSGLYLPQGVSTKENVAGGYIVNVGPGYPTAESNPDGEPWLHALPVGGVSGPISTSDATVIVRVAERCGYEAFATSDSRAANAWFTRPRACPTSLPRAAFWSLRTSIALRLLRVPSSANWIQSRPASTRLR